MANGSRVDNRMVERILDGALRSLARQGLKRLSMSDVAEEAGVSRGTVYRYFPSREHLLTGLGDFMRHRFESGLEEVTAGDPKGRERVRIVLEFQREFSAQDSIRRIEELQPAFALEFLRDNSDVYQRAIRKALQPAFDESKAIRSGKIDPDVVTDMFWRMSVSATLLEHGQRRDLPNKMLAIWDAINA